VAVNAATLEIDIKVDGATQAEQQVRGVGNAVDDTGNKMSAAGQKSSAFGKSFQSIGPMAALGVAGAGAAVAKFGMDSFTAFASFEKQMNEVFSLMPGISQESMGQMTEQVKAFSREFGTLPSEVVPALYESLSAGIPAENVFSFLEVAQKTATGGVTELNTAVDALTSVVNSFGADTITAADASDIMFQTVKIGKTTVDELAASLYNVNPVAAALGVGFDQVGAALAAMTSQGVPTAQATTQLRQLFIELSDSSSKLAGTFQTLSGQSFQQFIAGGGNVQQALQILEQHAASTGVGIQDLFSSVEAGGAALALTGQGTEAFSNALGQMENRAGSTEAAFTQMQSGVSADIDRMKANFATLQLDVGEKLAGVAVAIMDANLGQRLADSFAADVVLGVWDTIKSGIDEKIAGIQSAIEAFRTVAEAVWPPIQAAATAAWSAIESAVSGTISTIQGAVQAFQTAASAIWPPIQSAAQSAFSAIQSAVTGAMSAAEGAVSAFQGVLSTLGGAMQTAASAASGVLAPAISAIGTAASSAVGFFSALASGISSVAGAASSIVGPLSAAAGALQNVANIARTARELLPGSLPPLAQGFKDIGEQAAIATPALQGLTSAVMAIGSADISGFIGVPSVSGSSNRRFGRPDQFAAAVASPGGWTPDLASAWFEGLKFIAEGMEESAEMWRQIMRRAQIEALNDEIRRFLAWAQQYAPHYYRIAQEQGAAAAFRAYHGNRDVAAPVHPFNTGGGGGSVTVNLNVDGQRLAQVTAPLISQQIAANIGATMGGA
jgi:TP901 family phage tail tape measure protein